MMTHWLTENETGLISQSKTGESNPGRLPKGSLLAPCVICFGLATWDLSGLPYCERCGPAVIQQYSKEGEMVARFHSPTGFVWKDCGLFPADFSAGDSE